MKLNPVPCGVDGLLGDAHDAAHGLIVHAHFVEDEEGGIENNLNRNVMFTMEITRLIERCRPADFRTLHIPKERSSL